MVPSPPHKLTGHSRAQNPFSDARARLDPAPRSPKPALPRHSPEGRQREAIGAGDEREEAEAAEHLVSRSRVWAVSARSAEDLARGER
eukprot:scaffold1850_cov194-Pinguiococcus_pyrenoidosus.AAC.45